MKVAEATTTGGVWAKAAAARARMTGVRVRAAVATVAATAAVLLVAMTAQAARVADRGACGSPARAAAVARAKARPEAAKGPPRC